jgi:hypothetical protein
MDRAAVPNDVKVVIVEIHDPAAGLVLYVCIADVPLLGDRPVEDMCAGRHLAHIQGNPKADAMQRFPDPLPGDASADGEQVLHEAEHLGADLLGV